MASGATRTRCRTTSQPNSCKDTVRKCDADEEIEFASIPGNDFDDAEVLRTLPVAPGSGSDYQARFTNFGETHAVTYRFEKQGGQWRITNVE